jgi:hypothetical protein
MYAENLGKMPPNTALMRVYHSGKTEWLYASSDYQKSFGLILKHKILFPAPAVIGYKEQKDSGAVNAALQQ